MMTKAEKNERNAARRRLVRRLVDDSLDYIEIIPKPKAAKRPE